MCIIHNMATSKENQIDIHLKMEWKMYFSENLPGVNPVVMTYKIRHNKNRPATRPTRSSLVWPDRFFCYYLWWQKNRKTRSGHARLRARVTIEEGLLSVWVSQSIGQSWSANEYCYTFSILDLWEQGHKSYVASYRPNKELVILWMFSCELL